MLGQPIPQRLQPPGSTTDPVGQGLPIQLHALPSEDLGLPIKR